MSSPSCAQSYPQKLWIAQKRLFAAIIKKKLLKNYLKNLVQVDPVAAGLGLCVSAD